jgi:ubiquinone/menaquinone biosynthesis C-methylase UbiE
MPETMEFADHAGDDVLEIGSGIGTDLAQFARHGASVTDVDLAATHLQLAEENFRLRGLRGRFIHHDAESLPFSDHSFDLVYSNGVLHHTPNTALVVGEIYRVLRPGGRAIVMVYAENSWHYWRKLVWLFGVKEGLLEKVSMGEIMSRSVERSANEARPLVKVYTRSRARALFKDFGRVDILQRQLVAEELPAMLRWTLPLAERALGWNLIVKAVKPC